jgi:hypothetical protein
MTESHQPSNRLGLRLAICGGLLLAMSGYFAWAAFYSHDLGQLGYASILLMTAIGVLTRQIWAEYFVFAYTFAFIVFLCLIALAAAWTNDPQYSGLSVIISLVPGFVLSVLLLILCWQVRRGFQDST